MKDLQYIIDTLTSRLKVQELLTPVSFNIIFNLSSRQPYVPEGYASSGRIAEPLSSALLMRHFEKGDTVASLLSRIEQYWFPSLPLSEYHIVGNCELGGVVNTYQTAKALGHLNEDGHLTIDLNKCSSDLLLAKDLIPWKAVIESGIQNFQGLNMESTQGCSFIPSANTFDMSFKMEDLAISKIYAQFKKNPPSRYSTSPEHLIRQLAYDNFWNLPELKDLNLRELRPKVEQGVLKFEALGRLHPSATAVTFSYEEITALVEEANKSFKAEIDKLFASELYKTAIATYNVLEAKYGKLKEDDARN